MGSLDNRQKIITTAPDTESLKDSNQLFTSTCNHE
jgi:hypothetical protein